MKMDQVDIGTRWTVGVGSVRGGHRKKSTVQLKNKKKSRDLSFFKISPWAHSQFVVGNLIE